MLQWESPGTTKARELSDVYRILDCEEDLEGPDRVPGLFSLKSLLTTLDSCPLLRELLELVNREITMIDKAQCLKITQNVAF